MNWGRILNVFIAIFLMMNLVLYLVIEHKTTQKYTLSDEKQQQLSEILKNHDIQLKDFLPDYYPKSIWHFKITDLKRDVILKAIFSNEAFDNVPNKLSAFRYVSEHQEVIFYSGQSRGLLTYAATTPQYVPKDYTENALVATAQTFAYQLLGEAIKLQLTDIRPSLDGSFYVIEFNEVYKKEIIFSNYVTVKIDRNGISEAKAFRYEPDEIKSETKELIPVDEVLYRFMNKMEDEGIQSRVISQLRLGYDNSIDAYRYDSTVELVPYYRIKLATGAFYYVDAYTGKIYSEIR